MVVALAKEELYTAMMTTNVPVEPLELDALSVVPRSLAFSGAG
jgi:hypothetical protein